ncbi:hypothetical protein ACTFIV_006121 [Dictyostelium citrinum]
MDNIHNINADTYDYDNIVVLSEESINNQINSDFQVEQFNINNNHSDNNKNKNNNNNDNIYNKDNKNNDNTNYIGEDYNDKINVICDVNNNNNNNNNNKNNINNNNKEIIKYDNKCIFHQEQDYRFICSDCQVPVCDICIVSSEHHRSHIFDLINQANTASLFQEFKSKHFQNLNNCLEGIKESINDSNEIFKGLNEEYNKNVNTVTEEFRQIHSLLETIEKETIDRLVSLHDENKETNQKITITANDYIKNIDQLISKYKYSINDYNIDDIFSNNNNNNQNNSINGNSNRQHIELLKHSHQTQILLNEQDNDNTINKLISEYNKISLANSIDHVKNAIKDSFQIQSNGIYSEESKDPKRVKVGIDEFFIYKNGCVIPNGVVNLALGPSIKKLTVGSIPPTIKRLILLDGFKVQLSEGLLPNTIKSLLVGAIKKPLLKGSIPTGIAYLFLLDGFDQEIVEIPRNVSEIFLYNTSFIVPITYKGNLYKKPTYKQYTLFGPTAHAWSGGGWEVKVEM